jgi:hypothetical protein
MNDDLSKLGKKTAEEVTETLIVEIVKKVTLDDGDILVVRVADEDVFNQLISVLSAHNPNKKILLVNEDEIDLLRAMDEDEMRELGWVRANTPEQIEEMQNILPESEG